MKRRGGGGGGGALELAAGVPILKLRASKALRSAPRKMALMVLLHCSDRLCTRIRLWPYGVVYKTAHYSLIEPHTDRISKAKRETKHNELRREPGSQTRHHSPRRACPAPPSESPCSNYVPTNDSQSASWLMDGAHAHSLTYLVAAKSSSLDIGTQP